MISRKVSCAIMVLCELYCARPEEKKGRKMLLRTTLVETCGGENPIFRRVMQQLFVHKYVTIIGKSVVLTCNPAAITIYELFKLFHGGIHLGEEQEYNTDFYAEKRYQKIAMLEEDVAKVSRQYFERKTVASMIPGRQIYSKQNTNK